MSCFVQENDIDNMVYLAASRHHQDSNPQPSYQHALQGTTLLTVFCLFEIVGKFVLSTKATDYRWNFAKTILFENCSCFSQIPFTILVESPKIFQCLISIPAGL